MSINLYIHINKTNWILIKCGLQSEVYIYITEPWLFDIEPLPVGKYLELNKVSTWWAMW